MEGQRREYLLCFKALTELLFMLGLSPCIDSKLSAMFGEGYELTELPESQIKLRMPV